LRSGFSINELETDKEEIEKEVKSHEHRSYHISKIAQAVKDGHFIFLMLDGQPTLVDPSYEKYDEIIEKEKSLLFNKTRIC